MYIFRIKIELHFSLIAAAVTYIMWKNVGNDRIWSAGKADNKKLEELNYSGEKTVVNNPAKTREQVQVVPIVLRHLVRVWYSLNQSLFKHSLLCIGGRIQWPLHRRVNFHRCVYKSGI